MSMHGSSLLAVAILFGACPPGGDDDDAGVDAAPPVTEPCGDAAEHEGEGTYYDADGTGNCSFPASPGDLLVAAMNDPDWAGSSTCGTCAEVEGPLGSVTVRIVDRCPECASGDLDLSPQAFDTIAEHAAGRVPITWRTVPCDVDGNVAVQVKDGSNPFWTAVQVRNHRHGIASVEGQKAGEATWVAMPRESYNYFVASGGLGEGPASVRITDVHGHVIEIDGVPTAALSVHEADAQLPECAP